MAVYKIFPTQDTTLYSLYPEMNTGLDEILESSLEVGNYGTPSPQASRFLIQFDSNENSSLRWCCSLSYRNIRGSYYLSSRNRRI